MNISSNYLNCYKEIFEMVADHNTKLKHTRKTRKQSARISKY